jgi:hypothetical protein
MSAQVLIGPYRAKPVCELNCLALHDKIRVYGLVLCNELLFDINVLTNQKKRACCFCRSLEKCPYILINLKTPSRV